MLIGGGGDRREIGAGALLERSLATTKDLLSPPFVEKDMRTQV